MLPSDILLPPSYLVWRQLGFVLLLITLQELSLSMHWNVVYCLRTIRCALTCCLVNAMRNYIGLSVLVSNHTHRFLRFRSDIWDRLPAHAFGQSCARIPPKLVNFTDLWVFIYMKKFPVKFIRATQHHKISTTIETDSVRPKCCFLLSSYRQTLSALRNFSYSCMWCTSNLNITFMLSLSV